MITKKDIQIMKRGDGDAVQVMAKLELRSFTTADKSLLDKPEVGKLVEEEVVAGIEAKLYGDARSALHGLRLHVLKFMVPADARGCILLTEFDELWKKAMDAISIKDGA